MKLLRVFISGLLVLSQFIIMFDVPVAAAMPGGLVISNVISGESSSSNSEFVAIYNNAQTDIAVDGYCLRNKSSVAFTCVTAEQNTKVYVKSHGYLTIASTAFSSTHSYTPDTAYASSNAIQVGGDAITLVDNLGNEIDKVTWGTSGGGISSLTNGTLLRKTDPVSPGVLIDTDTMQNDFSSLSTLVYPANGSYDVVTLIDVCPNLDGAQSSMPAGYLADQNSNCQPDSCLNIAGLQISIPEHFDGDANGNCVEQDECDNIAGIQAFIPENMLRTDGNSCRWDIDPIIITEILPNVLGSDTGNEFIEIYNPTEKTLDLRLYTIRTGVDADKTYAFPSGSTIAPGEYRAFTDTSMKFTLLNTSSRVMLKAIDGSTLGDTGVYASPAEGESWALIGGSWEYTNRPTPGAANVPSLVDEQVSDMTDSGPAPCPAGKYRNPLTNRCRSIVADSSVLASCDSGQYRNPDTGRCKKIETSSLAPCKDGQYRSEETNRCRSIVTANTAKPCKESQYRSEETNRCRNIPASTVPGAGFAVRPVKETGMTFVGWWALGGVALMAAGYGIWEWRREISSRLLKYFSFFLSGR